MQHKDWDQLNTICDVSRETFERLSIYLRLLKEWQSHINLVSQSTLDDGWRRHIVDSAFVYTLQPRFHRWLDLGSGAGFPGMVVAILKAGDAYTQQSNDQLPAVTMIESVGKKCAFMNAVLRETGLRGAPVQVKIVNRRIEAALPPELPVDVVSARALASLTNLMDLTETAFETDAIGIFLKGARYGDEIKQARSRWQFECDALDHPASPGSKVLIVRNAKKTDRLER
ncbi:MAG: 16S rRNA (guanine(527)-N(7))-methyltransferase RsmG [Pseudomonadota bacterium]